MSIEGKYNICEVFLLDEYLKSSSFIKAVNAIGYRNEDILQHILSPLANSHAKAWWKLTYIKYLYPKAQLISQRNSEPLQIS